MKTDSHKSYLGVVHGTQQFEAHLCSSHKLKFTTQTEAGHQGLSDEPYVLSRNS